GTHQLGIYHNAYTLSHKLNYDLAKSAYHGVVPVFNRLVQDGETARLKKAFIKSLASTIVLVSLVSLPLLIWTEPLVILLLGESWLAVAPLIPWLVLAGIVHSVANLSYAVVI